MLKLQKQQGNLIKSNPNNQTMSKKLKKTIETEISDPTPKNFLLKKNNLISGSNIL